MIDRWMLAGIAAWLCVASAQAQQAPRRGAAAGVSAATPCPPGTASATIRHNLVKPGKLAMFEQAVRQHAAWLSARGSRNDTRIVRVQESRGGKPALSTTHVMTITRYMAPQPERDAAYAAFTARYRESASVKDSVRVCLPSL